MSCSELQFVSHFSIFQFKFITLEGHYSFIDCIVTLKIIIVSYVNSFKELWVRVQSAVRIHCFWHMDFDRPFLNAENVTGAQWVDLLWTITNKWHSWNLSPSWKWLQVYRPISVWQHCHIFSVALSLEKIRQKIQLNISSENELIASFPASVCKVLVSLKVNKNKEQRIY